MLFRTYVAEADYHSETGAMTRIMRTCVAHIGMPQQNVSGTSGEFPWFVRRPPGELTDDTEIPKATVYLLLMFKEIGVGGLMALRPVDERTAVRFHIVQVGGRSHHKRCPAGRRWIAVDVTAVRHLPRPPGMGPFDYGRTTAAMVIGTPAELTAAQLVHDLEQWGKMRRLGRSVECEAVQRMRCRSLGCHRLQRGPDRIPDLGTPVLLCRLIDQIAQAEIAISLEESDLFLV